MPQVKVPAGLDLQGSLASGFGAPQTGGDGTPKSYVDASRGYQNVVSTGVDSNVGPTDSFVLVDTTNGNRTITIPSPQTLGRAIRIIKSSPDANRVILVVQGGTINGQAQWTVIGQYNFAEICCTDGTNFIVTDRNSTVLDHAVPVFTTSDQCMAVVDQGSFVADNTMKFINVDLMGQSIGEASSVLALLVGAANQATPLYNAAGNPTGGASRFMCGTIAYDGTDVIGRRCVLTGLTVGATYNWQLVVYITGASFTETPIGSKPWAICTRVGSTGHADKAYVALQSGANGNQIVPFILGGRGNGKIGVNSGSGQFQPYGPMPQPAIAGTILTTPIGIARTPDGTKACACSYGANTICIVNMDTDLLMGNYTITGATSFFSVACDNTSAYVCDYYGGKVYKITLATGAVASTVAITNPYNIAITPDSTKIVVTTAIGTAVVVNATTMAITQTVNLAMTVGGVTIGATTTISCVAITPDNATAWVASYESPGLLVSINLTTYALVGYVLPFNNPQAIAIAPSGTNCWITYAKGGAQTGCASQELISGPYIGQQYVVVNNGWPDVGLIAIDQNGNIYVPEATNNALWEWPGAVFYMANNLFTGEFATVTVEG